MIRVLQVLEKISTCSGVSSVVMSYFYHVNKEEFSIDFMVHEEPESDVRKIIESKGSKIYVMPVLSGRNIPKYCRQLDEFFSEHCKDYDIIHGHAPNAAAFYMMVARKHCIPIRILHSHNSRGADGVIKKIRNRILNLISVSASNVYCACSNTAGHYLFGRREYTVIYNGIDLNRYAFNNDKRVEYREKIGVGDKIVIAHVGRFTKQKNQRFVIDLLVKLLEQKLEVCVLFAGSGSEMSYIKRYAAEKKVSDSCIFVGDVKNMDYLYSAIDVLVLPSLYEGLPVVAVEAQASGVYTLLSTNITNEVIVNANVERLEIDDIQPWVDKIKRFSLDKQKRINNNVNYDDLQKFSINNVIESLEIFYKSLFA